MAIENITSIENMLKLEEGTLQKAIESEELVKVELPEVLIRTKEEEETLKSNHEKEKKERYDSGLEVGEKRAVNSALESFGLSLDDKAKTVANFADAFKTKLEVDFKQPKDQKITELESDNEKLRKNLEDVTNSFENFKAEKEAEKEAATIDSSIMSAIPDEGLIIPKSSIHTLFQAKYKGKIGENNSITWSNGSGEVIKNETTLAPKTVKEVMADFIKPYIKSPDGGTGEGDKPSKNGAGTYDDFVKEMANKDVNEGSLAFQEEMQKRLKEKTLVV